MDQQSTDNQSLSGSVFELLEFVLDGTRVMSLFSYNEAVRHRCRNIVRVILSTKSGGAGYMATLAAIMSGACEMARIIAADTAPWLFPELAESAGWKLYLESSPLAMGACGVAVALIGCILYRNSIERYKARRGLTSIYPHYSCSVPNLAISIFALCIPTVGVAYYFVNRLPLSPILLFAASWLLSAARIKTLAPRSKVMFPLLALIAVQVVVVPVVIRVGLPKELITSLNAVYFMVHVLWACILGIGELRLAIRYQFVLRTPKKRHEERFDDCRTPKQWASRSLPYFVAETACLYIALCMIMLVPAFLISFNMLLLSMA